ncbi:hypothetical protein BU17DRAFT_62249 [Hysterangium stoloniferum]|nr:hypothetical protein BU17DRAFT_62249 [Hysterangium stoloniferum]
MHTYTGTDFKGRQREHFRRIIHNKWKCDKTGHGVCVPTGDQQHWPFSERHVNHWINHLVAHEGTTAEPPPGTFENIKGGPILNRSDGTFTVRAVAVPPARYHGGVGSRRPGSEGAPIAKFFRWLIHRRVQEEAAIEQGKSHISCLKSWQNEIEIGPLERGKTFEMLDDALKMLKPYSSKKINEIASNIGIEAYRWLHMKRDLLHTPDNLSLLLYVNVCIIPLLLIRISDTDPLAGDLVWDILEAFLPLLFTDDVPDHKKISINHEETTGIAIQIVARELAYSRCAMEHPWLAYHLLSIVEMTLKTRYLSESELAAISELAFRRREQTTDDVKTNNRSWEVALFAQCSSQAPEFTEVVLLPTGFPSLIKTIETNLAHSDRLEDVQWEHVTTTLRCLALLTKHDWVVNSDVMNRPVLVAIMGVFRRDIPQRRLALHYWAADTLNNILARRTDFVPVLVGEGILEVLSRVIPSISSLSLDDSRSSDQHRTAIMASLRDYKRRITERAKELNTHVRNYIEQTPPLPPILDLELGEEFIWALAL